MVGDYKIIRVGNEELVEIDCFDDAKPELNSSRVKKILLEAKTGNTACVSLKTRNYKKVYSGSEKKYYPNFVNYYLKSINGDIVSERVFETHKAVITSKGVENCYNIVPEEFNLSFNEIKSLSEFFNSLGDEDLPNDFFSFKKRFYNSFNDSKLLNIIFRYSVGFGLLELLFSDSKVQDVFIDSPNSSCLHIFHEDFGECSTNIFVCDEELEKFASKLRLLSGRPFDASNPILNTSIPILGVRVSGVMEPLTFSGVAFAFRKHSSKPFTLPGLIKTGFLSSDSAALLSFLVDGQSSMLITGSRGSGKTSLLSALLLEVPRNYRFIVIEDTQELPVSAMRYNGFKVQHLRVKSSFSSEYELSAVDALRAALRLGESVLVIGEVRGEEAKALFEAMRIGAAGNVVLGTIHGSTAFDTFDRIVNDLKVEKTSFKATDVVVATGFFRDKDSLVRKRRLSSITEVRKRWSNDPVSENGFFVLESYKGSEVIKRIAVEKGLLESEVAENISLRKEVFDLLVKLDLCDLESYVKIKDYYYLLFNKAVENSKNTDYKSLFSDLKNFIEKC